MSIFVVQKAAAPKIGVEFRQGSIGTIRGSLAMSYDVWRRRARQNANLGILPVDVFIYLCFTPTSLVPVEGIITMIRAIKTDQDFDTEWSPFGSHVVLDIRYMTNDSNFR